MKALKLGLLIVLLTSTMTVGANDYMCFFDSHAPNDVNDVNVFIDINGIEYGEQWTSSCPNPPDGVFVLEYTGDCVWEGGYYEKGVPVGFRWFPDYETGGMVITLGQSIWVFESSNDLCFTDPCSAYPCSAYFENSLLGPSGLYYGGTVTVTTADPNCEHTNFSDFAVLANNRLNDDANVNDLITFYQSWLKTK